MFHFQEIAPAVLISLGDNRTSSDAAYRCTGRCRVINPMMRPVSFEDRVETGVRKTGCDPEKVQRCFQERLAKAVPFLIKVFEDTVLGERNRHEILALMRKDRPLDRGDAQGGGIVDVSLIV